MLIRYRHFKETNIPKLVHYVLPLKIDIASREFCFLVPFVSREFSLPIPSISVCASRSLKQLVKDFCFVICRLQYKLHYKPSFSGAGTYCYYKINTAIAWFVPFTGKQYSSIFQVFRILLFFSFSSKWLTWKDLEERELEQELERHNGAGKILANYSKRINLNIKHSWLYRHTDNWHIYIIADKGQRKLICM